MLQAPPVALTVVYRTLNRRAWSLRHARRVVEHRDSVTLTDVRFVVSEAGARRVRTRFQREVVAYARGVLSESPVPAGAQRVRFNPYRADAFTLDDGSPIRAAALVHFLADGSCWASNLS